MTRISDEIEVAETMRAIDATWLLEREGGGHVVVLREHFPEAHVPSAQGKK